TRTVNRRVSAADDRDPGTQLNVGCSHPDIAQEWKTVMHALLILALGPHAIRFGQPHRQNDSVIVFLQVVPRNILADLNIGLDRDAQLHQALDLAVQHLLRQHPVRNPPTIQSARFRRLLKNRDFIAQSRQLVRRAVTRWTRSHHRDFSAIRLPRLDHVILQRLSKIAKKTLDCPNRNSLVVLPAIAGLLAWAIAHSPSDRRKRHVFLMSAYASRYLPRFTRSR